MNRGQDWPALSIGDIVVNDQVRSKSPI